MSYIIKVTDGQLAQMQMENKKGYEIVKRIIDNVEKDMVAIKSIKKAIKKLELTTVTEIVKFTLMGRVKVIRILNEQEGLLWVSEPHYGTVGKPTKKYKKVKKGK